MTAWQGPFRGLGDRRTRNLAYQDLKVTLNKWAAWGMFQDRTVLTQEELEQIQKDIAESTAPSASCWTSWT